jgi:hypothetical protein
LAGAVVSVVGAGALAYKVIKKGWAGEEADREDIQPDGKPDQPVEKPLPLAEDDQPLEQSWAGAEGDRPVEPPSELGA